MEKQGPGLHAFMCCGLGGGGHCKGRMAGGVNCVGLLACLGLTPCLLLLLLS